MSMVGSNGLDPLLYFARVAFGLITTLSVMGGLGRIGAVQQTLPRNDLSEH